jgi:hypothetical protein
MFKSHKYYVQIRWSGGVFKETDDLAGAWLQVQLGSVVGICCPYWQMTRWLETSLSVLQVKKSLSYKLSGSTVVE